MGRLIAFGCSNTFGQALPDVWDFNKNKPVDKTPSKYAWPQLLADKLNFECVNNGIQGNSPKDTWWLVMNFSFKDNDIVTILWPHIFRTTFFTEPTAENNRWYHEPLWPSFSDRWENHKQVRIWTAKQQETGNETWSQQHSKYYIKHYQFYLDCILDLYVRADQIRHFLGKKSIKNVHVLSHENINVVDNYMEDKNKFHIENIDMSFIKTFKPWHHDFLDYGLDNLHPGKKTHEMIADCMYKELC